jgi:RimJ/RimL family protein N-acetyltransferase
MRIDTVLVGKRVRLVPYLPEHVPRYSQWMADPEMLRLTGSEPLTVAEEYENQKSWHGDPDKATFIICARDDSETADEELQMTRGMCGDVNAFLSPIDDDDDDDDDDDHGDHGVASRDIAAAASISAEIEIMIADASRRRGGLAREAILLFFHFLVEHVPQLGRLVVKITDDNLASFRLFESLGFVVHKKLAVFEQTELWLDVAAAREMARVHWSAIGAHASTPPSPLVRSLRVLVLTYEFTYAPFSGNGVLARSLVKGLLGQGATVLVLCCRPTPTPPGQPGAYSPDSPIALPEVSAAQAAALSVRAITLPVTAGWQKLDRASAHELFATGAADCTEEVAADFGPEAVLAIDWTGGAAWRAMHATWPALAAAPPRMLYVNFRVYSSGLRAGDAAAAWYDEREREALGAASSVFALSTKDQASLVCLSGTFSAGEGVASPQRAPVAVLLPCLRGDMQSLADLPAATHASSMPTAAAAALAAVTAAGRDGARRFLTCAVRLSGEKNPLLFAALVEALAPELDARGLVPLLAGASADAALAAEVKGRIRAAASSAVILDEFLGAAALAAVFSATRLNVHPCLYDAYGMSVIEAAAFGAPSVVNSGGTIGATALLNRGVDGVESGGAKPEAGCVELDLSGATTSALAAAVLSTLDDTQQLAAVAQVARTRALGWSEAKAGKVVYESLEQLSRRDNLCRTDDF